MLVDSIPNGEFELYLQGENPLRANGSGVNRVIRAIQQSLVLPDSKSTRYDDLQVIHLPLKSAASHSQIAPRSKKRPRFYVSG
jgi:hypothetical protein